MSETPETEEIVNADDGGQGFISALILHGRAMEQARNHNRVCIERMRIKQDEAKAEILTLRNALVRVADWNSFPLTGKKTESGREESFGSLHGSNGERDFMRQLALDALAGKARKRS